MCDAVNIGHSVDGSTVYIEHQKAIFDNKSFSMKCDEFLDYRKFSEQRKR